MQFSDPALWYMHEEARREQARRHNQDILSKQVFARAEDRGIISIEHGSVRVNDIAAAINHFSHHPELVDMCPGLGWALRGEVSRLEPALSDIWRQLSMR